MLKRNSGFFAMWNGIAPDVAEDFALMHTRDHLAEHMAYLGENGILSARRHAEGIGTLPPFFTFYALSSLDPLTDPAFAGNTVHETAWFQSIRTHYRDRIAHHGRVLTSAGAGTGSAVGTFLIKLPPDAEQDASRQAEAMDRLTQIPAITAAHLGVMVWTVPIRIGQALPVPGPDDAGLGLLMIEGFTRTGLAAAMAQAAEIVTAAGIVAAMRGHGHYGFSYGLRQEEIADLRHFRRDRMPTIR